MIIENLTNYMKYKVKNNKIEFKTKNIIEDISKINQFLSFLIIDKYKIEFKTKKIIEDISKINPSITHYKIHTKTLNINFLAFSFSSFSVYR
jgi:hypothetical protein